MSVHIYSGVAFFFGGALLSEVSSMQVFRAVADHAEIEKGWCGDRDNT